MCEGKQADVGLVVDLKKRFVYVDSFFILKAFEDRNDMFDIDHAAGTGAALIVVSLHSSEDRDVRTFRKRKCGAVVLNEDRTFFGDADRSICIFIPVEDIFRHKKTSDEKNLSLKILLYRRLFVYQYLVE